MPRVADPFQAKMQQLQKDRKTYQKLAKDRQLILDDLQDVEEQIQKLLGPASSNVKGKPAAKGSSKPRKKRRDAEAVEKAVKAAQQKILKVLPAAGKEGISSPIKAAKISDQADGQAAITILKGQKKIKSKGAGRGTVWTKA